MSLSPAVLDALLAAGATAEMIVAAVKAEMSADIARAEQRKLNAAARQRKSRSSRKGHAMSRNVTVTECDLPNDIYSNPSELDNPEETIVSSAPVLKKRKTAKVGTSLPDDWQPILTPASQKIVDGWPPGWLAARVSEFRDHASDKGRKSLDWQAAFRKWLTNADEWGRQRDGRSSQNRSSGAAIAPDAWTATLREVANREPGFRSVSG